MWIFGPGSFRVIGMSESQMLVQLFSHLLWVMDPLLGPLSSVRYIVPHQSALLRVMLESYISTPNLLECPGLAFILVYMIIM